MPSSPLTRPVDPFLQAFIEARALDGMCVFPVDDTAGPQGLRQAFGFHKDDFGICAFMGHLKPKGIPKLWKVVQDYPKKLVQLNEHYNARLWCMNGGGNWKGCAPSDRGLMDQWARGATELGVPGYFVTMTNIVQFEGIAPTNGRTACIDHFPGEERIGARTDALINLPSFFVIFPGGVGTDGELSLLFTNISIANAEDEKKAVIFDPIMIDPVTNKKTRCWDLQLAHFVRQNRTGFISDRSARNINASCIRYCPGEHLSATEQVQELVSLTLTTRDMKQGGGILPLKDKLRARHIQPLSSTSKLRPIFPDHPVRNEWVGQVTNLLTVEKRASRYAL
ncbi:MAG: hypothetical protein AB7S81_00850 [Bdellovibrionales bacterium]